MSVAQAQNLINQIWNDIQQAQRKNQLIDAKANPDKYKLSRVMDGRANYVYYHGGWIIRRTKVELHRFCRSTERNIGGMYLFWREVSTYTPKGKWKQTERVDFGYSDVKKDADQTIKRRRDTWRSKHPGS